MDVTDEMEDPSENIGDGCGEGDLAKLRRVQWTDFFGVVVFMTAEC